ncbi:MAG: hypothetical protein L0I76_35170 [Pseudonocardia sp.]|nr:hypothetical protein [Pseudonocardia sp.]MDN5920283.1 hypothetical protein [Pseudonocardia sp.]MDN5931607.1 hypothetical protein [Pseudonocardia sp.]
MSTLLAAIGGHTLDLITGAGPIAVLLVILPLLVLAIGAIVAEPDGPPIRWTRIVAPTSGGLAVAALAAGMGRT